MKIKNRIFRKYYLCLLFSFALFLLVWLSEILRDIMLAVSAGWSSGIFVLMAYSVFIFFLFVFGIIPIILLAMLRVSPDIMRNIFSTVGLTEKSLDKKKTKSEKET